MKSLVRLTTARRAAAWGLCLVLFATAARPALPSRSVAALSAPAAISRPLLIAPFRQDAQLSGLIARLSVQTGSGNPAVAWNGERITYTIAVTNTGAVALSNVKVSDGLPNNALDQLVCAPACNRTEVPNQFRDPLGEIVILTRTVAVDWVVSSWPAGQAYQFVIAGRVSGQADGMALENQALVEAPGFSPLPTNVVQTVVRLRIEHKGVAQLSDAPTWLSADLGGAFGQDWGDFDRDGWLDLALATSNGATVYRATAAGLQTYWSTSEQAYGVAWVDLDGDGTLELVTVGKSQDGTATTPGQNFVFRYKPDQFGFVVSATLSSDLQLVRIAAGDFDRNGLPDLVGSTNAINAPCPVVLYLNQGNMSFAPPACVSARATAALGVGDFNNDGWPDLALGSFPDQIILLENQTGSFASPRLIDTTISFLPYDFAWGDYDGDGFLDLAAAFPLQREARVYRNLAGQGWSLPPGNIIPTTVFMTPLAVDWADANSDSRVDLLVGDFPPRLYRWDNAGRLALIDSVLLEAAGRQVWDARSVQVEPFGPSVVALANRDRASMLFSLATSRLATERRLIDLTVAAPRAGAIALGDLNADGRVDAALGAAGGAFGARSYLNSGNGFVNGNTFGSSAGPQSLALADVDADGRLELAVATAVDVRLYLAAGTVLSNVSVPAGGPYVPAWGDINGDGWLDLAVGSNGPVFVYLNQRGALSLTPSFATLETCPVHSLAWADYDGDRWMDLAVGCRGDRARVYRNNRLNALTLDWMAPTPSISGTLAWADYNGDSRPDLAIAGFGQAVQVFENVNGTLAVAPIWSSPTLSRTTSIAWGDWDDDGYPELAVGNDGEADQVFGNLKSAPGLPRLFWLWTSREISRTTGLAWGDLEGDGDLDLAVADADGRSGVYLNGAYTPAHYTGVFTPSLSLPNTPAYLSVRRPGRTDSAWFHSSPQLLAYFTSPTVTVPYRLFDADGDRSTAGSNAPGDRIASTRFEYSLDGGSTWQPATPHTTSLPALTETQRLGADGLFIWNARHDRAISDDARFRIRVIEQERLGPVQRASSSVVSPPFRVRATTCLWAERPAFTWTPFNPGVGQVTQFVGVVGAGSGPITYTWDFGDGRPPRVGQVVQVSFTLTNTYRVRLTVSGAPCPQNREVITVSNVQVGSGVPPHRLYLPVVRRAATTMMTMTGIASTQDHDPLATAMSEQVAELNGETDAAAGVTRLYWSAPEAGLPIGYRLYRIGPPDSLPRLIATLPPDRLSFEDSVACDVGYFVTALWDDDARESPASAASYHTPPCALAAQAPPHAEAFVAPALRPLAMQTPLPVGEPMRPAPIDAQMTRSSQVMSSFSVQQTELAVCETMTVTTSGIVGQPRLATVARRAAFWSTGAHDPARVNTDGSIEVFIYDADTLTFTQVTSSNGSILGGFNLWPSLSANGLKVAFASDRNLVAGGNSDGNFEVFVAEVGAGGGVTLAQVTTTTIGANTAPMLSGDGNAIVFVSDRNLAGQNADQNQEIFVSRLAGLNVLTYTQVSVSAGVVNDAPAINHDGSRVVFVQRAPLNIGQPVTIVLSSTLLIPIGTAGENVNPRPAISADGSQVAFVSDHNLVGANPGGLPQVFVYDVGAAQLRQVTTGGVSPVCAPAMNAGGQRMACAETETQLALRNLVSGRTMTLPWGGQTLRAPSLSGDGQTVAFVSEGRLVLSRCPVTDLSLIKIANAQAPSGGPLNYTIIVSNTGASTATNVIVRDVLPDAVFLPPELNPDQTDDDDSATGFGGGSLNVAANNITWTTSLAVGGLPGAVTLAGTSSNPAALPNNRSTSSWFSMSDNRLLLHLDETPTQTTFLDSSGLGHHATCSSCPERGAPAQVAAGLEFNGLNQFVWVPHDSDYNFATNQDFTVMAWVRADPYQPDDDQVDNSIIEKWDGTGSNGYPFAIRLYNSTSSNRGRVVALRYDRLLNPSVTSLSRIDDDRFHHIAFVRRSSRLYLYVDGVLESDAPDVTGSSLLCSLYSCRTQNSVDVSLGQRGGNTNRFAGVIDEVAIFAKGLTDAEVQAIYRRQLVGAYHAGLFESRVIDAGRPVNWTRLSWLPDRPWGKELPGASLAEFGYPSPTGSVNMTGNVLLLHLNELSGATTFSDTSGGGRHATCSGTACPVAGAPGYYGAALQFDGANDFIRVPDGDALDVRDELSMEAWVYPSAQNYTWRDQKLIGKTPIGSGYLLGLYYGRLDPEIWTADQHYRLAFGSRPVVTPGRWTHVAATFRAGDQIAVYVNGQQVVTMPVGSAPIAVNNTPLHIGIAPWNANEFPFQGYLDEVAVYSRTLSADEVLARYQRGTGRVLFQARSCNDPLCNGESFVGPDGSPRTFYSELLSSALGPPTVTLNLSANRYFQYRLWLSTLDPAVMPAVYRAQVGPAHGATSATQGECNVVGGEVECHLGALAPGMTATVSISAAVSPLAPVGLVTNTAGARSDADDFNPPNDAYTVTTFVTRNVTLAISKLAAMTVVSSLQTITYTIRITNEGSSTASGVVMSDFVPADIFVTGLTASGLACGRVANYVTCGPSNLNSAAVAVVQIFGLANPAALGVITNTAFVSATAFPAGATASVSIPVRSTTDVSMTLLPHGAAVAGDWLTYTARITNASFAVAQGVRLTVTLPPSVTSPHSGYAGCTVNPNTVVCDLGDLGPGAIVSVPVGMRVNAERLDPLSLAAQVDLDSIDFQPLNNAASISVPVQTRADLRLAKQGPSSVLAGQRVTYTLAYTQAGPSLASAITLTDLLPPGVDPGSLIVHGQTPPGVFGGPLMAGLSLTWTASALPPGAAGWITFSIPVTNVFPPAGLSNSAALTAATPDPSPANNMAIFNTVVAPVAPSLVVLDLPAAAISGTLAVMTATVQPPDVTLPITFTWTISNQTGVTQGQLSPVSVIGVTWTVTGTQTVNVQVVNIGGVVSASGNVSVGP